MTPFTFEGAAVRVVMREGEPWFVLADVCKVLDISHAPSAAQRLDDDEKTTVAINHSGAPATIINESGLYSLILTSRKPEAKRFKKWVTSEVLPAIRKTGSYNAPTPETREQLMARAQCRMGGLSGQRPDGFRAAANGPRARNIFLRRPIAVRTRPAVFTPNRRHGACPSVCQVFYISNYSCFSII